MAKIQIEAAMESIRKASEKIEGIIEPSKVVGFYVGTSEKSPMAAIILKIKRDEPLSDEQNKWLKQILSDQFNMSIELTVETILSEEAKAAPVTKTLKKKKRK